MASTGNTPIQLYYSNTAGNIPVAANLLLGELAINVPDGKLYYKNSADIVSVLASSPNNNNTWGGTQQFNNNVIITGSSGGSLVRITQTGAGPALTVEDDTNPDSTPFVVDATGSVGIGTSTPSGKLGILGSTVGANVGDQTIYTTFSSSDNGINNDIFQISNIRISSGAGWTGSGTRLQQKVDGTWMGYIQFNGNTNNGGISFGTGQSTVSANAISEALRINSSGAVGIGTNSNPTAILDLNNSYYSGTPSTLTQLNNKIALWSSGTTPTYGFGVSSNFLNITAGEVAAGIRFSTGGATERVRISNTGNVLIGTSTDGGYKLQVNGSFAATTKSFLIDHPTKRGMKLRYGSLESPYHGVRLTGDSVLIKGTATVELPEYIKGLCRQEGCQVQITNIKHGKNIWVENIEIDNNRFIVAADIDDDKEYRFYWSFTAIRKDIEDMIVEF